MKKKSFAAACILFMLYFSLSCNHFNHNSLNITISEKGHYYKMVTCYDKSRSAEVDRYMDKHFGKASNMSFVNSRIDGDIAMDDGTMFYIKKKPGYLEIKFDRNENSPASYKEVKALGDDLKLIIQQ